MKTTRKAKANAATMQPKTSWDDGNYKIFCEQVAEVRAVAQLLENVSDNRYECREAWLEFAMQIGALSEILMERIFRLETCMADRPVTAAAGGAR